MKKISVASLLVRIIGLLLIVTGLYGIAFTYKSVARENIVTPADASIPNTPVRGPFTLKAQADIIRYHTLKATGEKTYAEMPRQVAKLDSNGNPETDVSGKPIMVANEARNMWVTATTLITALNVAILAYGISMMAILIGLACIVLDVRSRK
jgi:hypothetical protein